MKENHHFLQIEKAIHFLVEEAHRKPSLDETAAHLGLSPFHFQRLFQAWAGVSPKKFQQYLSYRRAKAILQTESTSLFDVSFNAGLSGTARLHDLFVNITAMTPAEFRSGGKGLCIHYEIAQTPFGLVGLAATDRGLCRASFVNQHKEFLELISNEFPNATLISSPLKEKEAFLKCFSLPDQTKYKPQVCQSSTCISKEPHSN
ncbi:MAG: AraC family transcriptional regulator [Chloroherpetonaceae bacterium]|nr:AraC family transcriptional regulator [Chloroherpetonaceae bacterium]